MTEVDPPPVPDTVTAYCRWCRAEFEPTRPEQLYCSQTHKRKYARTNRQRTVCPRADKRKFRSRDDADQYRSVMTRLGGSKFLRSYFCICRSWHVGRPIKTKIKRGTR